MTTDCRVVSLTPGLELSTRDTVASLTPASEAMSARVAMGTCKPVRSVLATTPWGAGPRLGERPASRDRV